MSRIWKRIGSVIIDLSIIRLIATILLSFFNPLMFFTGSYFIVDLLLLVLYFAEIIAIATMYQYITFLKWGKSFGKIVLRQEVLNKKNRKVKKNVFLKREFTKYYLFYASLGIYGLINIYWVIIKGNKAYHEKKYNAYVVDYL